ncbi:hypothetical protein [Bacillus sp. Marseille-Q1617]|uniref:hypothetical protein n=1 Tax=Bacillus sp. Marseille-Q1617 TaxID=2736887 RepID=UPI00158CE744|nr:hypothetical protein [Bacillus sp. Marseille-Q1617]
MTQQKSHQDIDERLKRLEEDYVKAVKENDSTNIEDFIEQFLYDSWEYNDRNIDRIKSVLSRYSSGRISQGTFHSSFNYMTEELHVKLRQLDQEKVYPVLHSKDGASMLVAFVDGLVLQYYIGIYDVDGLRGMTPYIKRVILQMLKTEV